MVWRLCLCDSLSGWCREFGWVGVSCADSSSPSISLSTEQLFGNVVSQWIKTCPCTKGKPWCLMTFAALGAQQEMDRHWWGQPLCFVPFFLLCLCCSVWTAQSLQLFGLQFLEAVEGEEGCLAWSVFCIALRQGIVFPKGLLSCLKL